MPRQFKTDVITDCGTAILAAIGVPANDARLMSESLVTSDLWGHQSHGMLCPGTRPGSGRAS